MEAGEGYRGRIPFKPLQLTFEEQERCQELTLQLLDRTLRSYDERDVTTRGSPRHHSTLDSARWKRHKTQSNASLYSERHHIGRRDLNMPGDNWENPAVLLAVGTIQASLDDVMLGLTTQTFGDLRVRAASIASHDVSGATLAKLSGPTAEDPYQNLSVMWMVGEQGWPLSMIVRPRDFINLSASGIITRANGDRIGYDLVQPAQLPQLPELPKPMTRGKLMYGALYKEQDGTVDVYIQVYVETMGHILDTIVMNAMWIAVLGFWEAPRLAEEKKLQWCILNRIKDPTNRQRRAMTGSVDLSLCGVCKDKLRRHSRSKDGEPSANKTCAICGAFLCSKCRVKRSFKELTGRSKGPPTRSVHVVVCSVCLTLVNQHSATEVAWQQSQQRLQPESDDADSGRTTWGLLDDAITPSWTPGRYFSISDASFNFSDK
ncbi:hypothetical protein AM587_10013556 [Phytophthora nicotianae]|uniref:FYVE-type domain-containing protein n=1 Tax=Phytophthora nicotianae TaxID=4792 RepID=A0A0W8D6I7_PHYNI|nr:hypothetical protein AM588_10010229 [Phytophthora nicotianae]KUF92642.1 hypothetical protein AM587_10013556 [Phytophthora nicotianae]